MTYDLPLLASLLAAFLAFSVTVAFEVSDPRYNPNLSTDYNPQGEATDAAGDNAAGEKGAAHHWNVIDQHWMSSTVEYTDHDSHNAAKTHITHIYPTATHPPACSYTVVTTVGAASHPWHLATPCPDADLTDPNDAECLTVPFTVDRVTKNFYLPTGHLITRSPVGLAPEVNFDYILAATHSICSTSLLSSSNCDHLYDVIADAVVQRRRVVEQGSGRGVVVRYGLEVNGVLVEERNETVAVEPGSDSVMTSTVSCDMILPGFNSIKIRLHDHPGYSTGKRRAGNAETRTDETEAEPTEAVVTVVAYGGTCGDEVVEGLLEEPTHGGVYRTRVPVNMTDLSDLCVTLDDDVTCRVVSDRFINVPVGVHTLTFYGASSADREGCGGVIRRVEVVADVFTVTGAHGDAHDYPFQVNYRGYSLPSMHFGMIDELVLENFAGVHGVDNVEVEHDVTVDSSGQVDGSALIVSVTERNLATLFNGTDLTFVTACGGDYFTDQRLTNLVGSVQFWEKRNVKIVVYGLGDPAAESSLRMEAAVKSWRNVEYRRVPATLTINGVAHRTPDHMREGNKYAFKPAVIWDALEREEAVFWIDAGAEIRRPVDGVREILRDTGYFSVEHAFKFPDTRFHHPACVAQLGCDAVEGSRQHCATTYLGFRRGEGGEEGRELLKKMLECSMDDGCINPSGANRSNHRQEQTVMNSIVCAERMALKCEAGDKFATEISFGVDRNGGPWAAEGGVADFNEIELLTRRVNPVKPYASLIESRTYVHTHV